MVKILAMSDTHNKHWDMLSKNQWILDLPPETIFIHAGDFSTTGKFKEIVDFNNFLNLLPFENKFICAGNHDLLFQNDAALAEGLITGATYTRDKLVFAQGLWIYLSPWTPLFGKWAFMKPDEDIDYSIVPYSVDVLVTHGPPYGVLDTVLGDDVHAGSASLALAIEDISPQIHIFGHIHEGYGHLVEEDVRYYNVSICDRFYKANNKPTLIEV